MDKELVPYTLFYLTKILPTKFYHRLSKFKFIFRIIARKMYSNPPLHGSLIV